MRSFIWFVCAAFFLAGCGGKNEVTDNSNQPMLTLRVTVDAEKLPFDDAARLSDALMHQILREQDRLEGSFGGADFGAPRDGDWMFLVRGPCEVAQQEYLGIAERGLERRDMEALVSVSTLSCEPASAYQEQRPIEIP